VRIALRDEALLQWYFRQVAFERSTTGAMLERAEMFLTPARQYTAERARELAPLYLRRKANDPWDPRPLTAVPTAEMRAPAGYVPNDDDLTRAAIVGRRLMAMERAGAVEEMGSLELVYGVVGAHYEDRPADQGPMPRLYALLHVTTTGMKLLDKAERVLGKNSLDLPPYAKMRTHLLMRELSKYAPLRELFERAELEAEEKYGRACVAWKVAGEVGGAR